MNISTTPSLENSVTNGQIFGAESWFDNELGRSYLIIHFYGYVEAHGRKFMAQCETRDDDYINRYGKERLDAYTSLDEPK